MIARNYIYANMSSFFKYLVVLCGVCAFIDGTWGMTREQLKKSGSYIKTTCMPKNEVTEDMVGSIEQGKFLEQKNVMCYIACIYQMSGVVKKGKLNIEASLKQVDMLFPPELKEPTKRAVEQCKDYSKNYNDLCEASYWTAKCMYDADPANFTFP